MNIANSLPEPAVDWALFLDVDGTLVEIEPAPGEVRIAPRVISLLGDLNNALGGALALVSGRAVDDLDRLFAPLHLAAAGNHGLVRRGADGSIAGPDADPAALGEARTAFARFAEDTPGVLVEDKTVSVALHFRRAPNHRDAAERMAAGLLKGLGGGYRLQHGKMTVEIRPNGADKGTVVDAFMAEPPFHGRVPVFVGDDATDEDGFDAVNRLGGYSVRIGAAPDTAARWQCKDVDSLLDWLARLAASSPAEA
jgi:trehalose 6-phosphate phosphatase